MTGSVFYQSLNVNSGEGERRDIYGVLSHGFPLSWKTRNICMIHDELVNQNELSLNQKIENVRMYYRAEWARYQAGAGILFVSKDVPSRYQYGFLGVNIVVSAITATLLWLVLVRTRRLAGTLWGGTGLS